VWLKHSIDKLGLCLNKTNATKAIINSNTEKVNARLRAKRPLVKKTMSAEIKGNNINKTVNININSYLIKNVNKIIKTTPIAIAIK
jgi:hypothetical protein